MNPQLILFSQESTGCLKKNCYDIAKPSMSGPHQMRLPMHAIYLCPLNLPGEVELSSLSKCQWMAPRSAYPIESIGCPSEE